ncbi:MAG: helix-turn-helix domain-containing protein [Acidobacteriaceae bacterium]
MDHFGEDLRQERERLGISLETIADATKVTVRHLRALEEENFGQLPGGVFNKGIVRSYARFLNLEQEAWVNRFMDCYKESGHLKDDDASWIAFAENVRNARIATGPVNRLRWAGVLLLMILLAALGWIAWVYVGSHLQ